MKQPFLCTTILALASMLFLSSEVLAQGKAQRFEIGGQFSLFSLNSPSSQDFIEAKPYSDNPCKQFDLVCKRVELGVGARFTYNLTNHIALEAEGNFFPGRPLEELARSAFSSGGIPSGHIYQGQFGVKAGKRFKRFGVFMKIRPGFVGFTQASQFTGFKLEAFFDPSHGTTVQLPNPEFRIGKATYPSVDLGGVVELALHKSPLDHNNSCPLHNNPCQRSPSISTNAELA
jgi:hypothetical protein